MNYRYKLIITFLTACVLSSCGDINDLACNTNHPACVEESEDEKQATPSSRSTILIKNTSRSVAINTVNIVNHCATAWTGSQGVGIGKGSSRTFQVDPDLTYDIRVLYDNGTCDYQYDVPGSTTISVYRTYFNCPAPCA